MLSVRLKSEQSTHRLGRGAGECGASLLRAARGGAHGEGRAADGRGRPPGSARRHAPACDAGVCFGRMRAQPRRPAHRSEEAVRQRSEADQSKRAPLAAGRASLAAADSHDWQDKEGTGGAAVCRGLANRAIGKTMKARVARPSAVASLTELVLRQMSPSPVASSRWIRGEHLGAPPPPPSPVASNGSVEKRVAHP